MSHGGSAVDWREIMQRIPPSAEIFGGVVVAVLGAVTIGLAPSGGVLGWVLAVVGFALLIVGGVRWSRAGVPASELAEAALASSAGWYADPNMAGTQRYWDGDAWTDHVAPAGSRGFVDAKGAKRIATGIGLLFLVPGALITLNHPSTAGADCGSWYNSNFSDLDVLTMKSNLALQGGGLIQDAQLQAVANSCNDKLGNQRTIVLLLIGLGAGGRLLFGSVVRALGGRED